MSSTTLEERIVAIESELAELKQELAKQKSQASVPWWQRHFGAFKDSPYYDDAMRQGAEYRRSCPTPCDESDADVSTGH